MPTAFPTSLKRSLAASLAAILCACATPQRPPPADAGPEGASGPAAEAAPAGADAAVVGEAPLFEAAPVDGAASTATLAAAPGATAPATSAALAQAVARASTRLAAPDSRKPSKTDPDAARRAREAFALGVKVEASGDAAAAVADFERAAALDPELVWASFNVGLLRERLGDDVRAEAAYEQALTAQPDFAQAGQNLARLWIRKGQLEPAEKALRERLAKADGVALRVALSEVLLAGGKLDQAEAECRTALKADEKNVPAMVVLATTYGRKKRFELAKMVLENARQVDPADPTVFNRLGFVELALGNRPQALEQFRVAAALRPDYPEAHANYGALLADADDFAGAAAELELAVKYAPRSAGGWLNLGNAYRGLQQFEKAEQAYRKALELEPGLNDAHFDLAVLFLDVEKPGLPTLQRFEQGLAEFDLFEKGGGQEPRVAAYRKDAAREIDREKKRLAREEKDRARKEAEAKRKADEEAKARAEAEAEAAKAKAEADARAAAEAPQAAAPTAPAPAPSRTDAPAPGDAQPTQASPDPAGPSEPGSGK